jgi:hypothetical protein
MNVFYLTKIVIKHIIKWILKTKSMYVKGCEPGWKLGPVAVVAIDRVKKE